MKLSKIFLTILIFFTFTTKLYAADYTITCTNKTCQTNDTTIFNQTNLAPQDSFSKTVEIKNIHSKNIDISLHPISTSSATIIEKIDITVNNSSSSLYFNNSLKEFLNSTITLTLNSDHTQASFALENISDFTSLSYTLTYTSSSGPQGIIGAKNINSPTLTLGNLVLGTCSSGGTCTYHQNITDLRLEVTLNGPITRTLIKQISL